jgi:hypothetical protein
MYLFTFFLYLISYLDAELIDSQIPFPSSKSSKSLTTFSEEQITDLN